MSDVDYYKALIQMNCENVQKKSPATSESRTAWLQYFHALHSAYNAGALQFSQEAIRDLPVPADLGKGGGTPDRGKMIKPASDQAMCGGYPTGKEAADE